jgi:hypothetical protein
MKQLKRCKIKLVPGEEEEEEEELRAQEPSVTEVSFCVGPHHNVHCTLGVDT